MYQCPRCLRNLSDEANKQCIECRLYDRMADEQDDREADEEIRESIDRRMSQG